MLIKNKKLTVKFCLKKKKKLRCSICVCNEGTRLRYCLPPIDSVWSEQQGRRGKKRICPHCPVLLTTVSETRSELCFVFIGAGFVLFCHYRSSCPGASDSLGKEGKVRRRQFYLCANDSCLLFSPPLLLFFSLSLLLVSFQHGGATDAGLTQAPCVRLHSCQNLSSFKTRSGSHHSFVYFACCMTEMVLF